MIENLKEECIKKLKEYHNKNNEKLELLNFTNENFYGIELLYLQNYTNYKFINEKLYKASIQYFTNNSNKKGYEYRFILISDIENDENYGKYLIKVINCCSGKREIIEFE